MRRIVAAALVLVPIALARAGGDGAPPKEATPSSTPPGKTEASKEKTKPAPEAAKPAPVRKDAPPEQGQVKKPGPPPCEEVKPCPVD
ncbi:MAG TPA: hypothetical protein VLS93_05400 [Anaeromyxobacteraceae bacterium]|nr:hypothetical protein [Anaeromyxobacteraceae bacterium]